MYKIFKHRKLPCLGEMHINLQWYSIFPSLFSFFWFCNATFFHPGHVIKPLQPSSAIYRAPPFTGNLSEIIRYWFFTIWSYPVFEKWYPYPIRILFWLKSYYPYPKTIESVLWCTTYIFVLCLFCLMRQNNFWSYFAVSWTRLVEVVTRQVWNACPA